VHRLKASSRRSLPRPKSAYDFPGDNVGTRGPFRWIVTALARELVGFVSAIGVETSETERQLAAGRECALPTLLTRSFNSR
jgi:hypothetical protein